MGNVLPVHDRRRRVRVSRLSRDSGEPPTSFASVVLERLTGWLVLPVITLFGLAINPGLRELDGRRRSRSASPPARSLLLVIVLALTARPARARGQARAHNEGWRRFTAATRFGLNRLLSDPHAAARVLATGFAYQLVLVVSALMAARALGIRPASDPPRCSHSSPPC